MDKGRFAIEQHPLTGKPIASGSLLPQDAASGAVLGEACSLRPTERGQVICLEGMRLRMSEPFCCDWIHFLTEPVDLSRIRVCR